MCLQCIIATCDFSDRPGQSRTETVRRSYGNGAVNGSLRSFRTEIVGNLCGFRMEAARRWYGDCAIIVVLDEGCNNRLLPSPVLP